jgi:hypothetical protein
VSSRSWRIQQIHIDAEIASRGHPPAAAAQALNYFALRPAGDINAAN